ncbi:aryl hydrocarbon receptor-like [Erpetoichthys calabaricus]|uniref:Aryl hydrocarbon receptor-like n=1 Tax=Erpetoichthys calabaricus TaxID=27687 RepID=A0A8C4SR95_ERPCA|nr:aryl hydrocarbon receptor-like [Erpetoichthys calabaricus]
MCSRRMNTSVYASKKRKRPTSKSTVSLPEDMKINPSKRHRDRINIELEQLASLLPYPEHIINKLDKLSVMRITVSYLRIKMFLDSVLHKHEGSASTSTEVCKSQENHGNTAALSGIEGELMLQAVNGFVMIVRGDGIIFYTSHNIQDYLGYHQSDVINQNVCDLIHTEDREKFCQQLQWDFSPPDNSGEEEPGCHEKRESAQSQLSHDDLFVNRTFSCRMRCLLDYNSGFSSVLIRGKLKFLQGQTDIMTDIHDVSSELALFAIIVPVQQPAIVELHIRNTLFRTKHKLDFTPINIDSKGENVLGWTETELSAHPGHLFVHSEDMLYCTENYLRMLRTGDSGVTIFRLLTKQLRWLWTSAIAKIIHKDNKPDYIVATHRILTDAEGEEHLRKRGNPNKFFIDNYAALYNWADLLSPHARKFLQTIEQKEAKKNANLYDSSAKNEEYFHHDVACFTSNIDKKFASLNFQAESEAFPKISSDINIWEMLWHYELSKEDLEIISRDDSIKQMTSDECAEGNSSSSGLVSPWFSSASWNSSTLANERVLTNIKNQRCTFIPESHFNDSNTITQQKQEDMPHSTSVDKTDLLTVGSASQKEPVDSSLTPTSEPKDDQSFCSDFSTS